MKKPVLLLASALSLAGLSACGFHPVYGKNKYQAVGVEETLAQIEIANIPDREGQILRNALIDRFYRDGRPIDPAYTLTIEPIRETLIDLDITKSSDSTRGQLRLDTRITLNDAAGETVLERNVRAMTSYNRLGSEFATRVSEENTRKNAIEDLARQIETLVTLHLKG